MRKSLIGAVMAAVFCGSMALAGSPAEGTYDLLFKTGTLDDLPGQAALVYRRDVENSLLPQAATRDTGEITVALDGEAGEDALMTFSQGEASRTIGSFPASVGNPMIMYFVETVARDMAESTGGSPFYIRNRMKEALLRPSEIREVEADFDGHPVAARALTLRPFENDPNRERMHGFADLSLTVTMSEAVPGWYHTLTAEVPGAAGDEPIYSSRITLEAMETGQ